ncbi:MAG: M16 family metallopeptidase [Bacillota bacterium]
MVRKVTLENGVRILTEEIPYVRSAALGIWVDVGSRDENERLNGASHFIEHMMFKGTSKRTAKDIAEALDAVGGQLNAFTTKEYTCYYARVLDEHFGLAVDVLTDMLFNSSFREEDIEREKNVIVEEIKMYEDAPDELVHDVFASTLWKGHVLGRPVIGNADVVRDICREDLLSFYRSHYLDGRMVIAAAGNISHEEVVAQLEGTFRNLSATARVRQLDTPTPSPTVNFKAKDTEQVHLVMGTQGLPFGDERIYEIQVLNTVLGGGISSRLFQKIREDRGLVYNIYSYHSSYHDTGIFCIYCALSSHNVNTVLGLVMAEIENLRREPVGQDELRRAKDQIKGNFLLNLESVNTRLTRLGKSELYLGKIVTPDEVVQKVEAVTAEQVQDLALKLLRPDAFCLASVGAWEDGRFWQEALGRLS